MASSDMTALMLQMMKQIQKQQLAADEQRQFVAAILDRKANQTPAATRSTIEKSPPIKIDFEEFSVKPEDWTTWPKVHRAQLSGLGCADALTETAGDETKVSRNDFDRGSVDPDRLRKVQQAWVSYTIHCTRCLYFVGPFHKRLQLRIIELQTVIILYKCLVYSLWSSA